MHLLDDRFAGMAVGVGSSRILGRIHLADMEVGGVVLQCSFTVLEDNKVDLLFGLDNLKRHQCCIDLVSSQLHIKNGEISVPFLGDGQISKRNFSNEKQGKSFDPKVIAELKEMTA
jgi:DNA damage-inducible protein 1